MAGAMLSAGSTGLRLAGIARLAGAPPHRPAPPRPGPAPRHRAAFPRPRGPTAPTADPRSAGRGVRGGRGAEPSLARARRAGGGAAGEVTPEGGAAGEGAGPVDSLPQQGRDPSGPGAGQGVEGLPKSLGQMPVQEYSP